MAIGHEQRQRQNRGDDQALQDQQELQDLQKLEEGQELSPEQAGQLQPQLGNAALAALLARSAPGSGGLAQVEEEGEELIETQDEEELFGEDLDAPMFGGGGGGGGGGPNDPWDIGKLFGGDDDGPGGAGGLANPRLRASPLRPGEGPLDDEELPEDDPDDVEEEHLEAIEEALPPLPSAPPSQRSGDAVHQAVEAALLDAHQLARQALSPEDLVHMGGPRQPLGRSLAIARFLAQSGIDPLARALARMLTQGAASLLVPAGGASGAAARLATLAVCAQVAEAQRRFAAIEGVPEPAPADSGAAIDRAVALALAIDAWPRAMHAARILARKRRLHAPHIAARALGGPLADGDALRGGDLAPDSLAGRALASLIPRFPRARIPDLAAPGVAPVLDDEDLAVVDALLAEMTGGLDPRALPPDPIVDGPTLQPVLDGATDSVNDLGRAQVEFAAVAVAACQIDDRAPLRQVLVHGDRALRLMAREVVSAGDKLADLRGSPRPGAAERAAPLLRDLRETAEALDALRHWVVGTVASAAVRPVAEPTRPASPETEPTGHGTADLIHRALAAREGADRVGSRALLHQAVAAAQTTQHERQATLLLAAAALETGDRALSVEMLRRTHALAAQEPADSWLQVVSGSALGGLLLDLGKLEEAHEVGLLNSQVATARGHWLGVADGAIVAGSALAAQGDLLAAVILLLATARDLRKQGAEAAVQLIKARLAELRAQHGPAFDQALADSITG